MNATGSSGVSSQTRLGLFRRWRGHQGGSRSCVRLALSRELVWSGTNGAGRTSLERMSKHSAPFARTQWASQRRPRPKRNGSAPGLQGFESRVGHSRAIGPDCSACRWGSRALSQPRPRLGLLQPAPRAGLAGAPQKANCGPSPAAKTVSDRGSSGILTGPSCARAAQDGGGKPESGFANAG